MTEMAEPGPTRIVSTEGRRLPLLFATGDTNGCRFSLREAAEPIAETILVPFVKHFALKLASWMPL